MLTESPQLLALPSFRGKRASRGADSENVCSFKGPMPRQMKKPTLQTEIVDADARLGGRNLVTIKDWVPDFCPPSKNFEVTDAGIKVLKGGVYFLYSNFAFSGWGANAECAYRLKYGADKFKICRWKTDSAPKNTPARKTISRIQPCYLGFVTELKKDDVVSIEFNHNQKCPTNTQNFINYHWQSMIGVVKQS